MRKSSFVLMMMCGVSMIPQAVKAGQFPAKGDTVKVGTEYRYKEMLKTQEPRYHSMVMAENMWRGNWFVSLQGGGTALVGTPVGCNDLFGRTIGSAAFGVGKWHTPMVGNRIVYQGFKFYDCANEKGRYNYMHAELLWDILGCRYAQKGFQRWGLIPFAGLGIAHNATRGGKHFSVGYGIQFQGRFSSRTALTLEVGDAVTFQEFDGYGTAGKFGDHLFSYNVGLAFSFGKRGWKRVIDATPYMRQNEWLIEQVNNSRSAENAHWQQMKRKDEVINEMENALMDAGYRVEYDRTLRDYEAEIKAEREAFPKNNYSGLNSLRKRLGKHGNGVKEDSIMGSFEGRGSDDMRDFRQENRMMDGKNDGQSGRHNMEGNMENNGRMPGGNNDRQGGGVRGQNNGKGGDTNGPGMRGNQRMEGRGERPDMGNGGNNSDRRGEGMGMNKERQDGGPDARRMMPEKNTEEAPAVKIENRKRGEFGGENMQNQQGDLGYRSRLDQRDDEELVARCQERIVGAPVYVFFNKNTTNLTDKSQLVNIKAVAEVALEENLHIAVIGTADKETGSLEGNQALSLARAEYISAELQKCRVPASSIRVFAEGGVSNGETRESNRNTRIVLCSQTSAAPSFGGEPRR